MTVRTYQERIDDLNKQAAELGMNLDYKPEVKGVFPEQNDEWLKARKEGIGGSEAGAILGISKFQTAGEVAIIKLSDKLQNEVTPEQQYTLDFGHVMEKPLLKYYAKKAGFNFIENVDELTEIPLGSVWQGNSTQWRHPLYPFMYGDCDGYALTFEGEKIGIECKTYNCELKNQWESGIYGKGGVVKNPEYVAQVAHYMAVENLSRFDLITNCSNSANDFDVITFYRDLDFEKNLIETESAFWDEIQNGRIPDIKTINKYSFEKIVSVLVPEETKDEIKELPQKFEDSIKELQELSDQKSELKKKIEAIEKKEDAIRLPIIQELNDMEKGTITIGDRLYSVSYKPNIRKDVDKDKLSINYPEIFEDVSIEKKTSKIFRLSSKAVKKK